MKNITIRRIEFPEKAPPSRQTASHGCTACGKPIVTHESNTQPQVSLPSNWQMFKNLVSAAADAVKGGLDVRGPEEVEAVLKVCAECPKLIPDERGPRCGACGCFLGSPNSLGKVSLEAWHCPLGKW